MSEKEVETCGNCGHNEWCLGAHYEPLSQDKFCCAWVPKKNIGKVVGLRALTPEEILEKRIEKLEKRSLMSIHPNTEWIVNRNTEKIKELGQRIEALENKMACFGCFDEYGMTCNALLSYMKRQEKEKERKILTLSEAKKNLKDYVKKIRDEEKKRNKEEEETENWWHYNKGKHDMKQELIKEIIKDWKEFKLDMKREIMNPIANLFVRICINVYIHKWEEKCHL